MKLLSDWGFTWEGWRTGSRGEYLTLLQGLLLIGFVLLPVYPQLSLTLEQPILGLFWAGVGLLAGLATILLVKGLIDLGRNLTPLPYPKEDGHLVRTGVYSWVRHPLYSGLGLGAIAWTLVNLSLSHAAFSVILFIFFNIKANREEIWLSQKYPDYFAYQQQVKKLIPFIY